MQLGIMENIILGFYAEESGLEIGTDREIDLDFTQHARSVRSVLGANIAVFKELPGCCLNEVSAASRRGHGGTDTHSRSGPCGLHQPDVWAQLKSGQKHVSDWNNALPEKTFFE
jgi:hypothetical protein